MQTRIVYVNNHNTLASSFSPHEELTNYLCGIPYPITNCQADFITVPYLQQKFMRTIWKQVDWKFPAPRDARQTLDVSKLTEAQAINSVRN